MVQKGEMTRFGEQEQEILGYLHQWTNGAFWNRLIILDRASFNYESLYERSIKDRSYWFESQTTDVEAIQRLILDVGKKQNWILVQRFSVGPSILGPSVSYKVGETYTFSRVLIN